MVVRSIAVKAAGLLPAAVLGHSSHMIDDIQTDEAAPDTPLLFGRVLDGRGGGRAVTWDEAQAWQPTGPDEVLWVHLRRYLPGVAEWLRDDLGLPEPTIELPTKIGRASCRERVSQYV